MTAPLKVSQEARELAADSSPHNERWGMLVRAGNRDDDPLVQAFQRALDMGERRGLERAAEVAEADKGMTRHGNMDFGPNVAFRIAGAIRSLGDGEGVG